MSRAVITFVTAVSVLWHAMAGCCAHHDHDHLTAQTCKLHHCGDHEPANENALVGASHCHHAHGCSDPVTATVSVVNLAEVLAADCSSPQFPSSCPCDAPSHCSEQTCAFAAPETPVYLAFGPCIGLSVAFVDLSLDLTVIAQFSDRHGSPESNSLLSQGTLRRHLALSVLLI